MSQLIYIRRHSHKHIAYVCAGVLLQTLAFYTIVFGQIETQPADKVRETEVWKRREIAALNFLSSASECTRKSLVSANKCNADDYFSQAATEYSNMQSLLKDGYGDSIEASHIAEGFIRSGLPTRAIEFLIARPNISHESDLLGLLADTLFLLKDYKNAALTYKLWISTGCRGYDGFVFQSSVVMWRKKGGEDCSQLTVELRSRLELLRESVGEPSNLPLHNDPPLIDNWKESNPVPGK
jgi:hypothetical protein